MLVACAVTSTGPVINSAWTSANACVGSGAAAAATSAAFAGACAGAAAAATAAAGACAFAGAAGGGPSHSSAFDTAAAKPINGTAMYPAGTLAAAFAGAAGPAVGPPGAACTGTDRPVVEPGLSACVAAIEEFTCACSRLSGLPCGGGGRAVFAARRRCAAQSDAFAGVDVDFFESGRRCAAPSDAFAGVDVDWCAGALCAARGRCAAPSLVFASGGAGGAALRATSFSAAVRAT